MIDAVVGRAARIACDVTAVPHPEEITWTRDGEILTPGGRRFSIYILFIFYFIFIYLVIYGSRLVGVFLYDIICCIHMIFI